MKKRVIFPLILTFVLTSLANASEPNLVGWWKFDSDANDYSGYENHGTINGDPNWVSGQVDGALSFDGADDYVQINDAPDLDGMDAITLTAWIKTGTTG